MTTLSHQPNKKSARCLNKTPFLPTPQKCSKLTPPILLYRLHLLLLWMDNDDGGFHPPSTAVDRSAILDPMSTT